MLWSWCGGESVERFDELAELRKEVRRVGDLAQADIDALRSAGHDAQAARLQRGLGTPVEMLRAGNSDAADGGSSVWRLPGAHAVGHERSEIVRPDLLRHRVLELLGAGDHELYICREA